MKIKTPLQGKKILKFQTHYSHSANQGLMSKSFLWRLLMNLVRLPNYLHFPQVNRLQRESILGRLLELRPPWFSLITHAAQYKAVFRSMFR
ncbi:MAG: hypothetical protein HOA47_05575 [Verrucomicrobia bacterium]|nr:hypothetical protein [Verrucomicrobiota bacterium]